MSNVKKITTMGENSRREMGSEGSGMGKNNLGRWSIFQKASLAVFLIVTAWLLIQTAQLYAMHFSQDLFSAAEWSKMHRYPGYAKYLFAVQIISLVVLVITARAKNQSGISK